MAYNYFNELEIEYIQKVRLAFSDFYLFDKRLKKNLNRNTLIFTKDIAKIAKHEFSNVQLFVILYKEKS
jgi:hypothetical protein